MAYSDSALERVVSRLFSCDINIIVVGAKYMFSKLEIPDYMKRINALQAASIAM